MMKNVDDDDEVVLQDNEQEQQDTGPQEILELELTEQQKADLVNAESVLIPIMLEREDNAQND